MGIGILLIFGIFLTVTLFYYYSIAIFFCTIILYLFISIIFLNIQINNWKRKSII